MHRHRFEVLDGLRGVAATCVVLFHAHGYLGLDHMMPRGYLAVDFFFVLSGFVIAWGFGEKLRYKTLGVFEFWRARLIRLAPLSILGTFVGIYTVLLTWKILPTELALGGQSFVFYLLALGSALLFYPYFCAGNSAINPLNPPSWSLTFELAANIVYSAVAPYIGVRLLSGWLGFWALALSFYAFHHHSIDIGGGAFMAMFCGAARVSFSFAAGILLERFWRTGVRAPRVSAWILCLALVFVFSLPGVKPAFRAASDLLAVCIVLPAIVWAGASCLENGKLWRAAGNISYPLYAIHYVPLVAACVAFASVTHSLPLRACFLFVLTWVLLVIAAVLAHADSIVRLTLGKARTWFLFNERSNI